MCQYVIVKNCQERGLSGFVCAYNPAVNAFKIYSQICAIFVDIYDLSFEKNENKQKGRVWPI